MKRIYSTCILKDKNGKGHQCVGNSITRYADELRAFGGTWIDLLPDLTYEDGVILIEVQIEAQPFDGYTHEAWVYGASKCSRISTLEPHWSKRKCKNGTRHYLARGDWWLNTWCDIEFFPQRGDEALKVYLKASRTDAKHETDYDYRN